MLSSHFPSLLLSTPARALTTNFVRVSRTRSHDIKNLDSSRPLKTLPATHKQPRQAVRAHAAVYYIYENVNTVLPASSHAPDRNLRDTAYEDTAPEPTVKPIPLKHSTKQPHSPSTALLLLPIKIRPTCNTLSGKHVLQPNTQRPKRKERLARFVARFPYGIYKTSALIADHTLIFILTTTLDTPPEQSTRLASLLAFAYLCLTTLHERQPERGLAFSERTT